MLAFSASLVLSSCGGGGSDSVPPTSPPRVVSVSISPDTLTLEAIDATAQLSATARDDQGNAVTPAFSWTSTDTTVVTVNSQGLVTAVGNGMATVSVTSGSVTETVAVTVAQRLSVLSISTEGVTLEALGASARLEASAEDSNGHAMSVELRWESSEPSVATVDADGLVTARGNGMTEVTVTSGSIAASVSVRVQQRVAMVIVSSRSVTLEALGTNVQLSATANDPNGNAMAANTRWSSSDPSVATVNADGLVTAIGHGTTTVTVTSGLFSASVTVMVSLYPAIVLTPGSSVLEAFGASLQLHARALDADRQEVGAAFEWESSRPEIADVDSNGLVTAAANGTTTVTARADALTASATVRVQQRIVQMEIRPDGSFLDPFRFTAIAETVQFSVQGFDSNGHLIAGLVSTGRSRDPSIVTIDENLLATAKANGTTAIDFTAFYAGQTPSMPAPVRVQQVAESVEIEPAEWTFRNVNETRQFLAKVTDANGHSLAVELMRWGSADRRVAEVDNTGLVSVRGNGETEVILITDDGASASSSITGALEVDCESGRTTPMIANLDTPSLVEGATFNIAGSGFCSEASGNLVTVDDMVAEVTAATSTELTAVVPQFPCLPSRLVTLAVTTGDDLVTRSVTVRPDEPAVSLPVGQQLILPGPADKCLQFTQTIDSVAYVMGVQSTLLTNTNALTEVRLIASASTHETASRSSANTAWKFWNSSPTIVSMSRLFASPTMHVEGAEREVNDVPANAVPNEVQPSKLNQATDAIEFPDTGDIDVIPKLGDIVRLPGSANDWIVYNIGRHALWLVNTEALDVIEAKYSSRIKGLSTSFDDDIYPAIVDYFGVPELGNLGRVVVRITGEFGSARVLGRDDRTWRMIQIGALHSLSTLAHELTHVIQLSFESRGGISHGAAPLWLLEGQAELGEEIFGFAMSNRTSAQNYGSDVAYERADTSSRAWGSSFDLLGDYFGGAHPERPQECSWLLSPMPCEGAELYYAVGWSFLRWLTDQYAIQYPGGQRQLHRELMLEPGETSETIERLLGETMDTLLARWMAALYVDDRVAGIDPTLQYTSWNLRDIYRDNPKRLMPLEIPFASLEREARIRDGSIWYVRLASDGNPATAIQVRDKIGGTLSEDIQVWIVRLE